MAQTQTAELRLERGREYIIKRAFVLATAEYLGMEGGRHAFRDKLFYTFFEDEFITQRDGTITYGDRAQALQPFTVSIKGLRGFNNLIKILQDLGEQI